MGYEKARGILYKNELLAIDKEVDKLQPVYEAFANAWEAIEEKFHGDLTKGEIEITLCVSSLLSNKEIECFDNISVRDNGIGLNKENYERLLCLRDNSKGKYNRGTGRVQFLHFFAETIFDSIYEEESEEIKKKNKKKREVSLSKNKEFIAENAVIRTNEGDGEVVTDGSDSGTIVTFKTPLYDKKEKDFYSEVSANKLKEELRRHFLLRLCDKKGNLPKISINRRTYVDNQLLHDEKEQISPDEIPDPNKEGIIKIKYSGLDGENKIIETEKEEEFKLRSFILPEKIRERNEICLVSKGVNAGSLPLNSLNKDEAINNGYYMFLLSGKYIDERDSDGKGKIKLISEREFKERNKKQDKNPYIPGFIEEEEEEDYEKEIVLLDDIKKKTNNTILKWHEEIKEKASARDDNIKELEDMFLLDHDTVSTVRATVKNTDSDEHILGEVYKKYAKRKARKDAHIKLLMKEIKNLSPDDKDYHDKLKAKVGEFVQEIPLENKDALSNYVARRKFILDVFEKILDEDRAGETVNEDVLHNLIFHKNSENSSPESTDLWLINEEFIYFKGASEYKLKDMEYEDKKIFHERYSKDIDEYLNSNGQKRLDKRPDILLFPQEGKCIIIELKAPREKVAKHLQQINTYATLLRNYTVDEIQITSFYGYLIGENMNDKDIRGADPDYIHLPLFDYWYKPPGKIAGFERQDGTIYSEILKYSSLLKRAGKRNEMFIKKLLYGDNPPPPNPTEG